MILAGENLKKKKDYVQFEKLLDKSIEVLEDTNKQAPFINDDNAWKIFETESFNALKKIQSHNKSEPYSNWEIELVSGGKFPDITAEIQAKKKFGVEVKTSKAKNWKVLGGSIMETTRVEDVERINILFAKLDPFKVRTKRFEDCVSDVSVTHSPRYLIDFDIDPTKSIFSQIGHSYDEVRLNEKPFDFFKDHFRSKANKNNSDLWYLDNGIDAEEFPSLDIRFYSDLEKNQKSMISAKAMLLFPEIFAKQSNYKNVALWLLKMGILNNSLRDMFSASKNVDLMGYHVPSKFDRLYKNQDTIVNQILIGKPYPIEVQEKYPGLSKEQIIESWQSKILEYVDNTYSGVESYSDVRSCCEAIFNDS